MWQVASEFVQQAAACEKTEIQSCIYTKISKDNEPSLKYDSLTASTANECDSHRQWETCFVSWLPQHLYRCDG